MMNKVYVVYYVEDPWCGYWIKKIFSNEESAKKYVNWFNFTDDLAKNIKGCGVDYFEEDLLDEFGEEGK